MQIRVSKEGGHIQIYKRTESKTRVVTTLPQTIPDDKEFHLEISKNKPLVTIKSGEILLFGSPAIFNTDGVAKARLDYHGPTIWFILEKV